MIGRHTPPTLLPDATMPIASARRRLKYCPMTVSAGCTPYATSSPNTADCARKSCQIALGCLKDVASIEPAPPSAATG